MASRKDLLRTVMLNQKPKGVIVYDDQEFWREYHAGSKNIVFGASMQIEYNRSILNIQDGGRWSGLTGEETIYLMGYVSGEPTITEPTPLISMGNLSVIENLTIETRILEPGMTENNLSFACVSVKDNIGVLNNVKVNVNDSYGIGVHLDNSKLLGGANLITLNESNCYGCIMYNNSTLVTTSNMSITELDTTHGNVQLYVDNCDDVSSGAVYTNVHGRESYGVRVEHSTLNNFRVSANVNNNDCTGIRMDHTIVNGGGYSTHCYMEYTTSPYTIQNISLLANTTINGGDFYFNNDGDTTEARGMPLLIVGCEMNGGRICVDGDANNMYSLMADEWQFNAGEVFVKRFGLTDARPAVYLIDTDIGYKEHDPDNEAKLSIMASPTGTSALEVVRCGRDGVVFGDNARIAMTDIDYNTIWYDVIPDTTPLKLRPMGNDCYIADGAYFAFPYYNGQMFENNLVSAQSLTKYSNDLDTLNDMIITSRLYEFDTHKEFISHVNGDIRYLFELYREERL